MKDIEKPKEKLISELNRLRGEIDSWKRVTRPTSETERFLSNVFASIQDGISVLDKDYTIISVNPTMEKWYRHAMPLVGKKCYEAYHSRNKACDICPTRETLKSGKASCKLVPMRGPGGKITGWFDLYAYPLRDSKTNEIQGVIEYVRDITDRKRAEEEMLRERDFSDKVINSLPGIFYLISEKGRFVRWNSNLEEVSGYSSSEVSKMDPTDFFSKEEKGIVADKIREIFTQGKSDVEANIITKAGQAISYHLTGLRLIVDGERYFVGVGIDISDRKRAEEALRLTQFSVDRNSDPVYWIAPDAQIKYVNDTA
ncbi:MAG: PAS domain-containing protein, partial [Candidatus Omnitrophota bacterium]